LAWFLRRRLVGGDWLQPGAIRADCLSAAAIEARGDSGMKGVGLMAFLTPLLPLAA
jgi:hypothetical protein